MDYLRVEPVADRTSARSKARQQAEEMQQSVVETARKTGKEPPPYTLIELIGKGSFGRVYKGKSLTTKSIVAVKIIDIDESDTLDYKRSDSYAEFLKEINALQILSESKARNINHVIEALPVGTTMWMVTEHCGGGSVSTLMRPRIGEGLPEKWIIPILREVAEAIQWVHRAGIIHRDVKAGNVLITEDGRVQLCDFGVAGIVETKVDKRTTMIGTPHWMAPELFQPNPSYGNEVDIWAFGSLAYEMATSYPPNAAEKIPVPELKEHLQQHLPRLEGDRYSPGLRSLVAFCMTENPDERPPVDEVKKLPYISHITTAEYPTSSLVEMIEEFNIWENSGGVRRSLFNDAGAPIRSESFSTTSRSDDWNFSTTEAFDDDEYSEVAYGNRLVPSAYNTDSSNNNAASGRRGVSRRRPPPGVLAPMKGPLEKVFDPNTRTNYDDNSERQYGRNPRPTSDLPLRDDSSQSSIRDTLIDLDAVDDDSTPGIYTFPSSNEDFDTIRADRRELKSPRGELPEFSNNRRTQDWKFPAMAAIQAAEPEFRFPAVTPGSSSRPTLTHHPTEPVGLPSLANTSLISAPAPSDRASVTSLIDLDFSIPDDTFRPSTATSDAGSAAGNPFELERHASLYGDNDYANNQLAQDMSRFDHSNNNTQQDYNNAGSYDQGYGENSQYDSDTQSRRASVQLPSEPPMIYAGQNPWRKATEMNRRRQSQQQSVDTIDSSGGSNNGLNGYSAVDQFREGFTFPSNQPMQPGPRDGGTSQANYSGVNNHQNTFSIDNIGTYRSSSAADPDMPVVSLRHGHSGPRTSRSLANSNPNLPAPPSTAALTGTANNEEMMEELLRLNGNLISSLSDFRNDFQGLSSRRNS